MILPIDWLKEYVEVAETPEKLAEVFLSLGFPADEINDKYLDLEITPNRGDCLSILGLAREYAAAKKSALHKKLTPIGVKGGQNGMVSIEPSARDAVLRYSYLIAEGPCAVKSSPIIDERLKLIGLNSKNAIVDVTNYLMHEIGQPLHAFDLDKVNTISIGYAAQEQVINLINDQTAKLSPKNLIAKDGEHLIDLFGVCGGAIPAVDANTTKILVQAAAIRPDVIRRSSRASGISTPASFRYERYVDVELTLQSLGDAARLLEGFGYKIKVVNDIYPHPSNPTAISLTPQDYTRLNGLEITGSGIADTLATLGFKEITENSYSVPSWRIRDVNNTEALAEEVLRLKGFDTIPEKPLPQVDNKYDNRQYALNIRADLAREGWTENYSYSFVSQADTKALNTTKQQLIEISQPPSENFRFLRPNLKMGLVRAALANPWFSDIKMFEIGNVFTDSTEKTKVGFICTKKENINHGDVNNITVDSDLGKYLRLKRTYYYSEAGLDTIKPVNNTKPQITDAQYRQVSKYPPVVLDVAAVVDKSVDTDKIVDVLLGANDHILLAEVFDEYESEKLGSAKKSVAIRVVYQDIQKTLTKELAGEWHKQTVVFIKEKYHARIRGE